MMLLIVRAIVAFVTFSIGVSFVLIFTANRQADLTSNVQLLREVQSVPLNLLDLPEPTNSAQNISEFVLDYDPKEFHPRGDYFILGKKPKDFREFKTFELAVDQMSGSATGSAILETYSDGMHNSDYTVAGSLTKKQLNFIATPGFEEDFEYRFNGYFLKGGRVSDAGKNQAVVRGKLIKLKNGVKIAECKIRFRVEYLGC